MTLQAKWYWSVVLDVCLKVALHYALLVMLRELRNPAGWGNGTTIATLFARQGATIFGCDISLPAAERAASSINAENKADVVTAVHGDATSSASVRSVVDACMAKHGRIDILVNNVGRSYVTLVAYKSAGLLKHIVL